MISFLQYWKLPQAQAKVGNPLAYAASDQYRRAGIGIGDNVWIVTLDEKNRLLLVGMITVATLLPREAALQRLGRDVYDKRYYILPRAGSTAISQMLDIHEAAPDIQFESPRPKLTLRADGSVDGKQLQTIRKLTPSTAAMLEALLP